MSKKHAPTPWLLDERYKGWKFDGGFLGRIVSESGEVVYAGPSSFNGLRGDTEAQADANARFIVRAVNSHEALVEAIKDAIAFAERDDTYSTDPEVKAFSDKMAALLALAGKDS